MKTAIKNGKIVTYNNGISVKENQALIIDNNIIVDITENSEVEKNRGCYKQSNIFRICKLSHTFQINFSSWDF